MIRARRIVLLVSLLTAPLAASANPISGTWRSTGPGASVEITLSPDGAYERRDSGTDGAAMTVSGRWNLAPPDNRLRVTVEDWTPRRACGLFGCVEIRIPTAETYRVMQHDEERLILEDHGARVEFRRAG